MHILEELRKVLNPSNAIDIIGMVKRIVSAERISLDNLLKRKETQ